MEDDGLVQSALLGLRSGDDEGPLHGFEAYTTPIAVYSHEGELLDSNRSGRALLACVVTPRLWDVPSGTFRAIRTRALGETHAFRVDVPTSRLDRDAPNHMRVRRLRVSVTATTFRARGAYLAEFADETEHLLNERLADHAISRLRKLLGDTVATLASALDVKDPYTSGHQQRVSNIARAVAKELRIEPARVEAVRVAGVMHDIGKISIPGEVLNKPGRLSSAEFALIRTHPQTSFRILNRIDFNAPVARIVQQHHELLDGSGYPFGLTKGAIMLESQILTVADVAEAMTSDRPYRASLGLDVALRELMRGRGRRYEPAVVDAFIRGVRRGAFSLGDRSVS